MKISAENYNKIGSNSQIYILGYKPKQVVKEKKKQSELVTLQQLQDRNFAKVYYNDKLEKDGKLFNSIDEFNTVVENPRTRNNLFNFFRERAEYELVELNNKGNLTAEELEKVKGLREIISAIPSENQKLSNLYSPNISFTANIPPETKKKCHIAIHSVSAACAGISGAAGEGAAIGADTWFLRGAQAIMFLYLQNLLGVDNWSSLMYMTKQYTTGAYLGVAGARVMIGWLGIGGHAATAGAGSPAITGAVRGVNALLSGSITEKMGWGYVKSYENDAMTPKKQAISTAITLATLGILHFTEHSVLDSSNLSDIETALSKVPDENVKIMGQVIDTLTNHVNLPRAGCMFLGSFVNGALTSKNMSEMDKKEYFYDLAKIALLNTVFYEVINFAGDELIKEDAIKAIDKMKQELENSPEVYKEFQDLQEKVIDKLNLDKMDTRKFVGQFKDPSYTVALAVEVSNITDLLADKWRKRNLEKYRKQHEQTKNDINDANERRKQISKNFNPNIEKDLIKITKDIQARMTKAANSHHAMSKIAGYDNVKSLLNIAYIEPAKQKQEDCIPNMVLFYGPSGTGKTSIGSAIAQDVGTGFKAKNIGVVRDAKLMKWIKENLNDAQERYNKDKRFTIIQLNEFDTSFTNNPELLNEFIEITKDCVKKYHATFFLTSNNPLSINKNILANAEFKVPMPPASKEDIKGIVQLYVGNKNIEGFNLEEIANEFEKVKPAYAYSNSQIEDIIKRKLPTEQCTQKDFINAIRETKPIISKEVIDRHNDEQTLLMA